MLLKLNFEKFFCWFTKIQLPVLIICRAWGFGEPALGKGIHKIILCVGGVRWGGDVISIRKGKTGLQMPP